MSQSDLEACSIVVYDLMDLFFSRGDRNLMESNGLLGRLKGADMCKITE